MAKDQVYFILTENLYNSKSGLCIKAGRLFLNSQIGKNCINLCFANYGNKPISSITTEITLADNNGIVTDQFSYEYRCNIPCGGTGCDRELIYLQNADSRKMQIVITNIVYTDNTAYTERISQFDVLPGAMPGTTSFEGYNNNYTQHFNGVSSFQQVNNQPNSPQRQKKPGKSSVGRVILNIVAVLLCIVMFVSIVLFSASLAIANICSDENVRNAVQQIDIAKLNASDLGITYVDESLDKYFYDTFIEKNKESFKYESFKRGIKGYQDDYVTQETITSMLQSEYLKSYIITKAIQAKNAILFEGSQPSVSKKELIEELKKDPEINTYAIAFVEMYFDESNINEINGKLGEFVLSISILKIEFISVAIIVVLSLIIILLCFMKRFSKGVTMVGATYLIAGLILLIVKPVIGIFVNITIPGVNMLLSSITNTIFVVGAIFAGIGLVMLTTGIITWKISSKKASN
ncbi:MAG: hypothetical protein ACI4E1_11720 [Lachnospira sp.]